MDLRGLNFHNRARNRSESVRPDLWPDHAWVPALGCQGGVLYDLCGAIHGTNINTEWGTNELIFSGANDICTLGKNTNTGSTLNLSYVARFKVKRNAASAYPRLFDKYPAPSIFFNYSLDNLNLFTSIGGQPVDISLVDNYYEDGSYGSKYTNCAFVFSPGSQKVFLNGLYSRGLTFSGAYSEGAGVTAALGNRAADSARPFYDGSIKYFYIYNARALTASEVNELNIDPLLPFRRRTIQKYWVPSGGGTTTYFMPQFMNHKFIPSFNGGR